MKTLNYYDKNASQYASRKPTENLFWRLQNFSAHLPAGSSVLDLGCGGGHSSKWLLEHGHGVTSVDGSAGMAAEAERGLGQTVRVLQFEDLDYEADFDGVWASASLLHAESSALPAIWGKIHRAMKSGGYVQASFKELEADWVDGFGRYFCAMNLDLLSAQVTDCGFEILEADRNLGQGSDGVEVYWLSVLARKPE